MTPPAFKKFILLFVSLIGSALFFTIVLSCWSPDYESSLTLFAPEVMGPSRFQPFFFAKDSTYYPYDDKDGIYNERRANVLEWTKHFKGEVSSVSVENLVYEDSINAHAGFAELRTDTNTAMQWIVRHKDMESLNYLKFTKKCEHYVNVQADPNSYNYWDYDSKPELKDTAQKEALIKEALDAVQKAKSDFIKLRYGYQVVRLACYNRKYKECIEYYDSYVAPVQSNSAIKYWALALKARALYKLGAPQYSKYCYAMVFDRCNSRRHLAKQGYFWAIQFATTSKSSAYPDKANAIDYCMNPLEKIPVYALEAMLNVYNNFDLLDSIYRIQPKSEMLDWLLVRGVNQVEFDVMPQVEKTSYSSYLENSGYYSANTFSFDTMKGLQRWGEGYGYSAYSHGYELYDAPDARRFVPYYRDYREHDTSVAGLAGRDQMSFVKFVSRCAENNNTRKPELWNLCAAYLNCLNGNYKEAESFLSKVNNSADTIITAQKMIVSVLLDLRQLKPGAITENTENKIAGYFKTLNQCGPSMRCSGARSAFLIQLGAKYAKGGDSLKSLLCEAASTWGINLKYKPREKPIDQMIAFAEKKNKTPFEQLIANSQATNLDELYSLKGTILLTHYKFKEAKAAFSKSNRKDSSYADPFMIHIRDCHDCDFETAHVNYTKSQLAQRLSELETKAAKATGEDLAQTCFLLGNATYNMSYFGNSWTVTEYPWRSDWAWSRREVYWYYDARAREEIKNKYKSEEEKKKYDQMVQQHQEENRLQAEQEVYYKSFFDFSKVKEYYYKSLSATKNKEFAAKCCFMIAKCDQNQYYVEGNGENKIKYRDYFKKLKADYKETAFYSDAIKECEYFRRYVIIY